MFNSEKIQSRIPWLILILAAIGLAYFAFLGTYNRYYADDWCYNADFVEKGLSETLAGYSDTVTYSASRFSLSLFAGLLFPLGIPALRFLTTVVVVLLLIGIYWLIGILSQFFDLKISQLSILTASALTSYFAIYIAPHQYQSFFWLIGILPYTVPLLFSIWITVLIGQQAFADKRAAHTLPLIGLLAFFAGGFSEAGTAFLLTILILLLAISLFFRKQKLWAQRILMPSIWGLAFALLAALILVLAPTSWERLSRYGEPAGIFQFANLTLRYSWDFVRLSLQDLPLPHLALAASAALLGILPQASSKLTAPKDFRKLMIVLGIISLIAYLLIAASYAPSALIEKNPPHPRTRVIARSTMLFAITLLAWLSARWLSSRERFKSFRIPAALLLTFLCVLYIGRSLLLASELQPIFADRANIWDQRDAVLQMAALSQEERVEVQAIDGQPIGGLRDFREASSHWVNVCAARVYGVGEISGLP